MTDRQDELYAGAARGCLVGCALVAAVGALVWGAVAYAVVRWLS